MTKHKHARQPQPVRRAIHPILGAAVALALGAGGLAASDPAHAQATTGSIFGQAPTGAGQTVTVSGSSGVTRQVAVDAAGRYTIGSLPLGSYTVTLQRDGQAVDSRSNVSLRVGAGTEVSFASAANAQTLSSVTVTASGLPTIDVTGVDSRTVITSQQLARLPLARSAEAIALLAPGVVEGSGLFSGTTTNGAVVSFGGSSVTENAYYINGFNTTDPISGFGGLTLPYGAIDQQEILTGGYDAAYGRSDGGVISQVGKRGTNTWHFGGRLQWTPTGLQGDPKNFYYVSGDKAGQIYRRREGNKSWTTTADAYVGGPLIEDRLYFFAAVEAERKEGTAGTTPGASVIGTGPVTRPKVNEARFDNPKWYAKVDWNINDSNILELTGASNKSSYRSDLYAYDYATGKRGGAIGHDTHTKNGADLYSAKFTSYLTDDLTVTALYGEMKGTYYSETPGYDPTYPYLINPDKANPAITGGKVPVNSQVVQRFSNPEHSSKNTNLRLDISYHLGDHTITAGIDNQNVRDDNDGQVTTGPGYNWNYASGAPGTYIIGGPVANGADWQSKPWVEAPGGYAGGATGYYVSRYVNGTAASVRVKQHAQYVQDSWQINDRWLVKLGLRNDQFTNYNGSGQPYLRLTSPQWAPRLGFSWDVNGDSSFKVYGNAGRYYLALPASVALRAAGGSINTDEFFTYTGIDANGIPTGLTPIKSSTGGAISTNGEYGVPPDPKTVAAANLKSEYQDEYILGFDKKLGDAWVYGAKATFRNLRRAIDDFGDTSRIVAKMTAMGIDPSTYAADAVRGSYLINPGQSAMIRVQKLDGGYYMVPMDWRKDMGFASDMKRRYYGLNLYLEHPFDGKWYGKIDYLFSRSYGNSEGQVKSDVGQTDVSATSDWDYAELMEYANGALSNDRRHQIKAYGSYQIAPEWMLSGNLSIMSGAPKECLGLYGPNQTNPGLGYTPGYYHWCSGKPYAPGDHRQPWTYQLSLSAEYRPEWAGKHLAFDVMVYNVLNQRRTTQTYPLHGDSANVIPRYETPFTTQTPRYVRFGVAYDF